MNKSRLFYISILGMMLLHCKKPYEPPATTMDGNYLVVEGFINTGADTTFVNLSRTVVIDQKNSLEPELKALITIESDANESYNLQERTLGNYIAPPLNLNNDKQYRLRIQTAGGQVYLSDFVATKISQPIDSISWEGKSNGLQLYVNTHDDSNQSRYYRWEFTETWQFNSEFYSGYIARGNTIVERDLSTENINVCWASDVSKSIILGSSAKLTNDVIHKIPLNFIQSTSEKVSVKYSVLVKQYVLTKEAFDFWEVMRKNTESLGSIFDAQPSQISGNIKNTTNAAEPVIGFISAGTTQKTRIFVSRNDLPTTWNPIYPSNCVQPDSLYPPQYEVLYSRSLIPVSAITDPSSGAIIGYTASNRPCTDCTVRGSNRRPAIWQ